MRVSRLAALLAVVSVFICLSVTYQGDNVSAVGNPINGSGTNGRIEKFIGSQCVGSSVIRENASGRVGIGATSPAAKFLVQGGRLAVNGNEAGNTGIFIANQNGSGPIATFSKSNGTDVKVAIGNDGSISVSGQEVVDGSGRFVGEGVQKFNPNQVALLRWYEANESGLTFDVGESLQNMAFDGANIWVVNRLGSSVTKLRANDGMTLDTFPVPFGPTDVVFDGANIWVSSFGPSTVTKLRASDGMTLGTFPVGRTPHGVAFDGANIWVAIGNDDTVTKLRANDGTILGTFPVGVAPFGVAFDGANIWVTNGGDHTVTKLRASDGMTLGTFAVGNRPLSVAFDGANMWVVNETDDTVTKL